MYMAGAVLYAWARPLDIDPNLDHTWVTNYQPPSTLGQSQPIRWPPGECFWFCWGTYHSAGSYLGHALGDLGLSTCLVKPNDPQAHGTIFVYAVDGVCHQLANQVLYSTADRGPALTVANARGYRLSHFLYGPYGRNPQAFWQQVAACKGGPGKLEAGMDPFADVFTADLPPLKKERLDALRNEFRERLQPMRGVAQERNVAGDVNGLINAMLAEAAKLLTVEEFRSVFGVEPGQHVNLVDPRMAGESVRPRR